MDPHQILISTLGGGYEEDVESPTSPGKGNKRLFSHRFSANQQPHEDGDSNGGDSHNDKIPGEDKQSEKRHRASDWPLSNSGENLEADVTALGTLKPESPTTSFTNNSETLRTRPSKFIEGSMNNRVSRKPPRAYIATEDEPRNIQESKGFKRESHSKLSRYSNQSVPALAEAGKAETGRQSTIFRFGKSLAASFNPSNWKIWSRTQDEEVSDNRINTDAQAKLERAYREVKRLPPTPGSRPRTVNIGSLNNPQLYGSSINSSGKNTLDADSSQQSQAQKRYGRVFMDPPSTDGIDRQEGSISQYSVQASASFKDPPVPYLQVSHKNSTRPSMTPDNSGSTHTLKHIPSRQELKVQQKLVKRVSDLEMRLEDARLELAKALASPALSKPMWSGKGRFVPGALPSLPSESLLSGYTSQNEPRTPITSPNDIGTAITTDERINPVMRQTRLGTPGILGSNNASAPPASPKSNHELSGPPGRKFAAPKLKVIRSVSLHTRDEGKGEDTATYHLLDENESTTPHSKKRKSIGLGIADDGGQYERSHESDDQDDISDHVRIIPVKRTRGRPSKQPKAETPASSKNDHRSFVQNDGEMQIAHPPHTQPTLTASSATKRQEDQKLIQKRRPTLETQASRIPRKGSRKETPPPSALHAGSTKPHNNVDAAAQATQHDVYDGVVDLDSLTTPATPNGARKLQKAMTPLTPLVTSDTQVIEKQRQSKTALESKGNVEEAMERVVASTEKFEWGPDVF